MARNNRRYDGFNGRSDFYHRSLGKHFLDYEHEPVISIGTFSATRIELAKKMGCCHLAAAKRLNKRLDEAGIDTIGKLQSTPPDELIKIDGIGTISMFVVMCVLDAAGKDAEGWYGLDDDTVTVNTLRAREARASQPKRQARA